jgi:hypothetical protein
MDDSLQLVAILPVISKKDLIESHIAGCVDKGLEKATGHEARTSASVKFSLLRRDSNNNLSA